MLSVFPTIGVANYGGIRYINYHDLVSGTTSSVKIVPCFICAHNCRASGQRFSYLLVRIPSGFPVSSHGAFILRSGMPLSVVVAPLGRFSGAT